MKIQTKRPLDPDARKIILSVRFNEKELDLIKKLAEVHADGNLNAWIRHAAIHFKLKK